MEKMTMTQRRQLWLGAGLIFLILGCVRLTLTWGDGLVEDEAYYWIWGRVPSLGYFDHTAGIGLLGWAWGQLFGIGFDALRILMLLLSLITGLASFAAYRTLLTEAQRQWDGRWHAGAGLAAILIGMTTVNLGHTVWVPDALFFPCLSVALWQICRLLSPTRQRGAGTDAWLFAGLAFGLGLLAKEIMVLYAGLFCLAALFHPRLRADLLCSVWPWAGLLLIIMGGLPTLQWNAENDWILLRFQGNHAFEDGSSALAWRDFGNLLIAYVLFLGPLAWHAKGGVRQQMRSHWPLWLLVVMPSLLFVFLSLQKGLQTHWAMPSIHPGMLLLLAVGLHGVSPEARLVRWMAGAAAVVVFVLLAFRPAQLAATNYQPTVVFPVIYEVLQELQAEKSDEMGAPVLLLANRYQEASLLGHARARADGYEMTMDGPADRRTLLPALNTRGRSNHFDYIWRDLDLANSFAIVIARGSRDQQIPGFSEVFEVGEVRVEGGVYAWTFGRLSPNPRPQLHP